jgi:hypothetical protein
MSEIVLQPAWALAIAATHGNMSAATYGYPIPELPYFRTLGCHPGDVGYAWGGPVPEQRAIPPPAINWSLWNGTDDIATFLNTQDIVGGWNLITVDTIPTDYAGRDGNPLFPGTSAYTCTIATWMLPYVSGRAYTRSNRTMSPPVWPGWANVVTDTPVAIDRTFNYTGECDGVIVTIKDWPLDEAVYNWGTEPQYPRAGYVSFLTDSDAHGPVQPFTWGSEIVCAANMWRATGWTARARAGVVGTLTPWITSFP